MEPQHAIRHERGQKELELVVVLPQIEQRNDFSHVEFYATIVSDSEYLTSDRIFGP